ncbi:MAG: divergent polysaccharide deacetylase family protein [Treponema sp.]|nr:divergent polysaccharide deacetylase family protein [Treponema sp.]
MARKKSKKNKIPQVTAIIVGTCAFLLTLSIVFPQLVVNSSKPAEQTVTETVAPVQESKKQEEVKKSDAKKVDEKKTEPKKTEPKKIEPKTQLPPVVVEPEKQAPVKQPEPAKQAPQKQEPKPQEHKRQETAQTPAPAPAPKPTVTPPKKKESLMDIPAAKNNALLIFVFDDGGQNIQQLQKILTIPFPITVAVLPGLPHSVECAALVRKSGNELILHQPMQALNDNVNPGPGAIKPDMRLFDIQEVVRKNIQEIGPVAGLNNHEGSRIMENKLQIGAVLDVASELGIFFLDSRTTVATQAPQAALERDMLIYSRDVFLDNKQTQEEVLSEIQKGLAIANKKGYSIMIGHVWSANLIPSILTQLYPELKEKGYRFSVVSKSGAQH